MSKVETYINSGILEEFVLGLTTSEETLEVNNMAMTHAEIRLEIEAISKTLEQLSASSSPKPNPTLRTAILGTIDYQERLKGGEEMTFPPILNSSSKIVEFDSWISRPDMSLPGDFKDSFAKIIGANEIATTMIVWLTTEAPHEVHVNVHERFLILEGTCEITIGADIHSLKAGDFIEIPLYIGHELIVTSTIPCKIILQRVAA